MRDRPPPPPSLSIDLRAEEKFRNASLNRDAMQKKKRRKKRKEKKVGPPIRPLVPTPPLQPYPFFPRIGSTQGWISGRRRSWSTRPPGESWMIAQSPPHIPIGVRPSPPSPSFHYPPPVRFHGLRFSSRKFIHRSTSARGRSRNSNTFHHVITFIKFGRGRWRAARRPSWTPKFRRGSKFYERNGGVVGPDPAIPLAILPTTGCGQRVQTDGSGSWDGREGWVVVSFVTTGPSGNSPSTGSQNAMVPRFRAGLGPPSPPLRWIHLNVDSMDWLRWEMLILEVIPFHDRSVAIDFFLWDRSVSFRQLLLFLLSFALEILFWNYRMFTYPWWNVYFYRRVKIDLWMIWFVLLTFFLFGLEFSYPRHSLISTSF